MGGQLERMDDGEQRFAPPFILATPRPSPETISPLNVERPLRYSYGGEGKISFEPEDTDWVFSASILYGRSNSDKHVHQQSYPVDHLHLGTYSKAKYASAGQFMDTKVKTGESHAILDFQAGNDAGLGMFGGKGSSVLSVGVRFAQFTMNSNITLKSDPDFRFHYYYFGTAKVPVNGIYHSNAAAIIAARSFRGVGPSISWNASAPVVGNSESAEIALDWGVNASLLFGRQKAIIHHQSTARYQGGHYPHIAPTTLYQRSANPPARARSVTVPNVGGFAGLSFLYSNAKVSLGYRGDFFFGAMDGGIDVAKSENRGFYGPFATISIGVGG